MSTQVFQLLFHSQLGIVRKVTGGMGGEKQKKNMQGRVTAKTIVQRRSEESRLLQSELHCRAYRLYPPEWQLGSHLIRQF